MESARREWIDGGGDVDGLMATGSTSDGRGRFNERSSWVAASTLLVVAGWLAIV
jgi:hypothetical protein